MYIKKRFILLFLLQSTIYSQNSVGEASVFLNTDHWAYTYINLLQDRGFLPSLYQSVRPYKRLEIASALQKIEEEKTSTTEKHWIDLLRTEFASEMDYLDGQTGTANTLFKVHTNGTFYKMLESTRKDFFINPEINYHYGRVAASVRGRIDNGILHDPTYTGRKTDLVAARVEDGYGLWQAEHVYFLVGRFTSNWSPIPNRSLILSDNPYTYDKLQFGFQTKHIAFQTILAKLDNEGPANRYFSAHRLDLKLNSGINVGLTETVIYGGINQGVDLSYSNPFLIFAEAQLNDHKEANENIALDVFVPYKKLNFRGQLLIDDFILDGVSQPPPNRKTSPDRLGWLFSAQFNDLFFQNSQAELTYERLGSYTYNVKQKRPFQSYTYYAKGLGAPGNDGDALDLTFRYFPIPKYIFSASVFWARQGERSLASNDFEDSSFVKLSFPSGTVQKTLGLRLNALYQHSRQLFAEAEVGIDNIYHYLHQKNSAKTFANYRMTVNYIFDLKRAID